METLAINDKNEDEYRNIAYQIMKMIILDKVISGFVTESLKKYTDEITQLWLYKTYLLMGLPIEGNAAHFSKAKLGINGQTV
ncbi:MAG: hypothetical protein LBJ67_02280 [Planctomycetaceae bacterium]|nr:hypothetical protein [Planctomycetaceae bacterium]